MTRFVLVCILSVTAALYSGCTHTSVPTRLGIQMPGNLPPEPVTGNIGVALVLGGGGARGLVHVGVLEVFEEEGIPIDLIVGTSAGAAVGALYASFVDAQMVKRLLLHLGKWDLLDFCLASTFRMAYETSGPISGYSLEKFFLENLPERQIEELKIPFAAVSLDIETAEPFIIKSGPIAPAVHASAAIPPLFSPIRLYGKLLADGGISLPVPVAVAKTYNPKLIISINITNPPQKGHLGGSFDLTYRSLDISYYTLACMQSGLADIAIHPNLEGFGLFDDSRNEEIYRRGIQAARNAIPAIKQRLFELGIPLKVSPNSYSPEAKGLSKREVMVFPED